MLNGRLLWLRKQWDRLGAWLFIAAGALVLFIGWLGVSSTPYPAQQLSYVFSAGMAGIVLVGVGTMLWLSADMRDEWYKLDRLEDLVRRDLEIRATSAPNVSQPAVPDRKHRNSDGAARPVRARRRAGQP